MRRPRATSALAGVTGLHEPTLDGRTLRARADHGASAVPAVLSALDSAGVGVASVTVARPRSTTSTSATPGGHSAQNQETYA